MLRFLCRPVATKNKVSFIKGGKRSPDERTLIMGKMPWFEPVQSLLCTWIAFLAVLSMWMNFVQLFPHFGSSFHAVHFLKDLQ